MQIQAKDIQLVKIETLKPHPKNMHKHSKDQIDRLCKLIEYQGFRNPIIVQKGTDLIVAGHGRILAAKKLKIKEVPVIYQEFESEAQLYSYIVSDNAIGKDSWATLDLSMINTEMLDFGPDFDIDMLGIKDFVIEPIEKYEALTDEDEVPEVIHPITRRGDVWLLGNHRLMCGDSTMIDDVEKLMNGEKADMVFTSPPYNGDTHLDYGKGENKKLYDNNTDKWTSEEYINFCHQVLNNLFLFSKGFIFWNVNYNSKSRYEFIKCIYPYIEHLWETIAWKKTGMPISSGLTRNFEFIFCFKNGERKHLSEKFKTEFNHWEISNIKSQDKANHRACFPVELPQKGIEVGSNEHEIILEPFCGSGSTLIACEKTNRKCYGIELDEKYCDVIINRWKNYTGKKATLESTGQTYEDLKKLRGE